MFHKQGLDAIAPILTEQNIKIYSTGGTLEYLKKLGCNVIPVEHITSYPSILDGRVKTLHPKIFGGILAQRNKAHTEQLKKYDIPAVDCVVVDLYPFVETLAKTDDEATIIEKIDIGGIALIRAAAKNYKDVLIIPSQAYYEQLYQILKKQNGVSTLQERKRLAAAAFKISSSYDKAIARYFEADNTQPLRYGENPHQNAYFIPEHPELFVRLQGKPLSYNNYMDVHAAIEIIEDFWKDHYSFAILKHNNPCGLATRPTILEAWKAALAGDPVSAFGGIIITNGIVDLVTAQQIDKLFYEVLIAKDFTTEALDLLSKKKKRVLLKLTGKLPNTDRAKQILNGTIYQQADTYRHNPTAWNVVSGNALNPTLKSEMLFANRIVKHLKSNAIAITKDRQLIGMACGQTSRVDALNQSIDKAIRFNFNFENAVLASDAFFPFDDCVRIADKVGIKYIIQPGGSIRDQDSIAYCDAHDMTMVLTGIRHFKH